MLIQSKVTKHSLVTLYSNLNIDIHSEYVIFTII